MSENALVKQQTNLTEVKKDDNKKIFFSLDLSKEENIDLFKEYTLVVLNDDQRSGIQGKLYVRQKNSACSKFFELKLLLIQSKQIVVPLNGLLLNITSVLRPHLGH